MPLDQTRCASDYTPQDIAAVIASAFLCIVTCANMRLENRELYRLKRCKVRRTGPQKLSLAIMIATFGASAVMLYAGIERCDAQSFAVYTFVLVGFGCLMSGVSASQQKKCKNVQPLGKKNARVYF